MTKLSFLNLRFQAVAVVLSLVFLVALSSCELLLLSPTPTADNAAVFDTLWSTVRDRYPFFEFKRVDWQLVRTNYRSRALAATSNEELFAVLRDALNELKDDHTNLFTPFNISRARPYFQDSTNVDDEIIRLVYFRNEQMSNNGFPFIILERDGKRYGYIRYTSFSNNLSTTNISYAFKRCKDAGVEGVIIDIRGNGGGRGANGVLLASFLAKARAHVWTEVQKTGLGATDYGTPIEAYVSPSTTGERFTEKRVAVLTDRNSYSASSFFSASMKAPEFSHVRLIGDHTGGGSGNPADFQLPNGWTYRFSSTKCFIPAGRITREQALGAAPTANHDVDKELGYNFEAGVPVDIFVKISIRDRSRDAVIERGVEYCRTGQ